MSKLIKEFKALPNDVAKWKWLLNNQGTGLKVMCDNDDTWVEDIVATEKADEGDMEYGDTYANFDDWIGCSEGVFSLLDAIGIEGDGV